MTKAASAHGSSVLVVEDEEAVRFGICGALRALGFHVVEADTCESATRVFAETRPDVVVTDLRLPDGEALDLLPRLLGMDPTVPVFIVTGYGTIDLAVRAVKQGAEDFLTKPVDMAALAAFARAAIERRDQRRAGTPRATPGSRRQEPRSPAMLRVEEQVERLRNADCSVLLLGETGTGKSVLARRIHALGARAQGPFVDVNCAGLTKEFVESELFGHERGAFTGAHAAKPGLLDAANGGTLFLDEIGDIDLLVQPKLLKVLEEKRFRRMGDVRERSVDVRLVAATHHDLLGAVGRKEFRADLYYRISTVSITIPALRERREDLVALARDLLGALGADDVELAHDAERVLLEYAWPGNLRELKNVLERALLQRNGSVIQAADLRFDTPTMSRLQASPPSGAGAPPGSGGGAPAAPPTARTLSEVEREHILAALVAESGRVEAAARRLGIPRSTLYQRIKEYGIHTSRIRMGALRSGNESDGGGNSG